MKAFIALFCISILFASCGNTSGDNATENGGATKKKAIEITMVLDKEAFGGMHEEKLWLGSKGSIADVIEKYPQYDYSFTESLEIRGELCVSLMGIEKLPNLKILDIIYTSVEDIEPLSACTKLINVYIMNAKIKKIPDIPSLHKLRYLSIELVPLESYDDLLAYTDEEELLFTYEPLREKDALRVYEELKKKGVNVKTRPGVEIYGHP
jgi:hypothetical protein